MFVRARPNSRSLVMVALTYVFSRLPGTQVRPKSFGQSKDLGTNLRSTQRTLGGLNRTTGPFPCLVVFSRNLPMFLARETFEVSGYEQEP